MKTENTNPATQYCFPAEALQEYFISPANVEEFARTMRLFSKDISEYFLQDGNVPTSIARGVVGINEFIEVLSPYFYNPNNK